MADGRSARKTQHIGNHSADKQSATGETSFFKLLSEAIDETLTSIGESARDAIYYHLEKTFGIKNNEIPYRIDEFSTALEKIFGPGAKHLEIMFMKNLFAKFKTDSQWNWPESVDADLTFAEYIRLIKNNLAQAEKKGSQKDAPEYSSINPKW